MKKLIKGIILKEEEINRANIIIEEDIGEWLRFRLEHYAGCLATAESKELKSMFQAMIHGYIQCLHDYETINFNQKMLLDDYYIEMAIMMECEPTSVIDY